MSIYQDVSFLILYMKYSNKLKLKKYNFDYEIQKYIKDIIEYNKRSNNDRG